MRLHSFVVYPSIFFSIPHHLSTPDIARWHTDGRRFVRPSSIGLIRYLFPTCMYISLVCVFGVIRLE
ncbi:hypothetical protein BJV78DRAFT_15314 [Lactifluus subvellereus]|nr:hypothetical protein BJV78DRAFT_15314 [Lactifluus subvellereus]